MSVALPWYGFGFLLVGWGLTLGREMHWAHLAALPLERVLGYAVLGGLPFFVVALVVALVGASRSQHVAVQPPDASAQAAD